MDKASPRTDVSGRVGIGRTARAVLGSEQLLAYFLVTDGLGSLVVTQATEAALGRARPMQVVEQKRRSTSVYTLLTTRPAGF